MKFNCSVDIDLPRAKVIELYSNPDHLKEWQDGYVGMEHLSGEKGQVGATSKIMYQTGKRKMELIETITVSNFPLEFSAIYDHKHMTNKMSNHFVELSDDKTRWKVELEYIETKTIIVKLMMFFFPSIFKKQVQKWLDQFKIFVEKKENLKTN